MESRLAEEWTPSEIEEARSLLDSLNDNSNNNRDDTNTKHNGIVDDLPKLFPWKTMKEATELHVELIAERHMMQSREKSSGGSDMQDVDPMSTVVSNSLGISDEEKAMLDAEDLLLDYPLEEMETQDAPAVEENEVTAEVETHDAPAVENEVEVLENQADRQPVVPQKGMPWTTEEHSLFLRGVSVLGRGKWKSISKHFVTTRTPVQISSHAQKYFQKMERSAAAERQRRGVVDEAGNRWMTNAEFAARAFAFAGVNYDPCLGLPPNPSFLEDLAKIWSPLLYRPRASQAWGERVVVPAAAPMEGAGTSAAAGHGASLPQQWTGGMH